ncbi:Crp/Fnr family transcriptional regulator [Ferruginibacter sp.]
MTRENLASFILATIPLHPQKVEEIVAHFSTMEIGKNEYFITAGQYSNRYLYLEKGFIRAFTFDTEGNEVTTAFYNSNQVVFEVAAFFQKTVSKENFQALEDCCGWYIDYDQLQLLFHTVPEFREFGRMILVKGFAAFKQRTLSLINETAEQRYETLVQTRPELFQKAPLKHIASYLGITDSSLSRIRREFSGK